MFPQNLKTCSEAILLVSQQTILSINIAQKTSREVQNFMRRISHEIKIATYFNVANSVRHKNKVLALKTCCTAGGVNSTTNTLLFTRLIFDEVIIKQILFSHKVDKIASGSSNKTLKLQEIHNFIFTNISKVLFHEQNNIQQILPQFINSI